MMDVLGSCCDGEQRSGRTAGAPTRWFSLGAACQNARLELFPVMPCVRAQLPPKGNLPSAPAPISWVLIYVLMSASQLGAPPTHSYSWRCAPVTSGARVSNNTCEWLSTLLYLPKVAAAHMFIRPSADLVMPGVVLSAPL